MTELFDVALRLPLAFSTAKILMFATFFVHLVLVLLMLGTAILALVAWEDEWSPKSLRSFTSLKSLAVVFGIAPILLMQVTYPVAFLNSVHRIAPLWISLIILISAAFFFIDIIPYRDDAKPRWQKRMGKIGLLFLLSVPAVFVTVVVGTENQHVSDSVTSFSKLLPHGIFRYFHILGAAVLLGGLFQYFFSARGDHVRRRKLLITSIGGILWQIAFGVALYMSLTMKATLMVNTLVALGVLAASFLLWRLIRTLLNAQDFRFPEASAITFVLLLFMLGGRQALQESVMVPLQEKLGQNASEYYGRLESYRAKAVTAYQAGIEEPQKGPTKMYMKSCAFCHGVVGNGGGPDSVQLKIQPADLANTRVKGGELRRILLNGVLETAMPNFGFYTRGEIDELMGFLDQEFGVLHRPRKVPVALKEFELQSARQLFSEQCADCHGADGKPPMNINKNIGPLPSDFSQHTLEPEKMFDVITRGYAGTDMQGYSALPEQTRWALVQIIQNFYTK